MLIQAGIAGPMVLALIVQTGANRERGPVHIHLFWLLVMILGWMMGMVLGSQPGGTAQSAATLLMVVPACFMAPLFCLLMARFARVEVLEQHPATSWALLAPFVLFLAGFATNDSHGLMADPTRALVYSDISTGVGAGFWAFQVWSNCVALVGLAICVRVWRTTKSSDERRRMNLLGFAAALPMAAHAAYVFQWLPLGAPVTPAALGLTAILVVAAIQRYRLLEVQPIARRDVVEASSDGVIVADVDAVLIDLNPAAASMLGAPRDALHGLALGDVLRNLGRTVPESALEHTLEALSSGESPDRIEVETEDGRVFEVSGGSPIDGSGTRAGSFVVLRDRSNERRAERMLHQSQKLESVGILAAGVAHEVNNPLAFVRANLAHLQYLATVVEDAIDEFPKEVAEEVGDMPEVIEESLDGLDRIHGIVEGLLRFSRLPSTRNAECDVNAVVRDASRFASLDRGAAAPLECCLAEDLPVVEASADQLVQVLLNLFLNAKHALKGRRDGCIRAVTSHRDGHIEIRVEDNGPGVADDIRAKIFDPFFTTGAPNEGTGLGLSIAFDIVRDHGGVLELESSSPGGTCFLIRLPVSNAPAASEPAP